MYKITLIKSPATWNWFTRNPDGTGSGSCHSSKRAALEAAMKLVPAGSQVEILDNGKSQGTKLRKSKPFAFNGNKDCDGNGNTNDIRADRAAEARHVYGIEAGFAPSAQSGNAELIQDLICDLGHLCDREELDLPAIIKDGVGCWREER